MEELNDTLEVVLECVLFLLEIGKEFLLGRLALHSLTFRAISVCCNLIDPV